MRKLCPILALPPLLVAGVLVSAAEPTSFSAEDLLRLDRLSDPNVAPDGRSVVFTVHETDMEANTERSDLWHLDLTQKNAEPQRLTQHEGNDSHARWAPDGRAIYFLSERSGTRQVWRLNLTGGDAVQVTRLPVAVATFLVSPRGDRLALSLEVFPGCEDLECTAKRIEERARSHARGQVYDRLFVRHWDSWKNGTQAQLFSIALNAQGIAVGEPVNLSHTLDADVPSKPRGRDEEITFSPDGRMLVFTARLKGKTEPWSTNFDLFEVAANGSGTPRNLTIENPAWDTQPTFSRDGRRLAWLAMKRPGFEADRFELMLRDLKTGQIRSLTADWDRSLDRIAFSHDGRRIFGTGDHLGQHPLWAIEVSTGRRVPYVSQGDVADFSVGSGQIVYALTSLSAPTELHAVPAAGGPSQALTHFNRKRLATRRMGPYEQFSFRGWNDETVYGFAMKPTVEEPGRKYPLAFIVHGGPQGSFGNGWSFRWNPQVYVGAGYGVVFIDFHGSVGYGQNFTDSISGDWGGKPLEDLQKGLAAALEKYPWLDGQRVCALGASYGGYMINWIAGNWPERFRCLINHAGVFDQRMMYYATEELWFPEWEHGGPYFLSPAQHEKHNPVLHVDRWRTPMLVIHGEQDFRVPVTQGIAAFTALQRRGIESRLLYFPDENHWVLKPHNSLQWHREVLAWLERWLQ